MRMILNARCGPCALAAASILLTGLGGCSRDESPAARLAVMRAARQRAKQAPQLPPSAVAGFKPAVPQVPLTSLTQYENGPGVVVCEPVAPATDADTRSFGAGCSRWLRLAVCGHGELGRNPGWQMVDRVLLDMDEHGRPATP